MKLDFYASQMNEDVKSAINELGRQEKVKKGEEEAKRQRKQLLKQAEPSLIYHYLAATGTADKDAFRAAWQTNPISVSPQEWLDLLKDSPDLTTLPPGSFLIRFTFKLQQPYVSRDDNDFYIIDNPLVQDKVFRWPMVRPSAWKGSLIHALWQLGYAKEDRGKKGEQVRRLFGTVNDDQPDAGKRGRLYLYPTFFTQSGLEVINPHERERRVGKLPILMECVPAGTSSNFSLLYIPFGRIGEDAQETRQEVAADLQLVAEGLQAMMTTYGFGAKVSSGFGLVAVISDGTVVVNYPDEKTQPAPPVEPESVHVAERAFADWEQLQSKAAEVAKLITGGCVWNN